MTSLLKRTINRLPSFLGGEELQSEPEIKSTGCFLANPLLHRAPDELKDGSEEEGENEGEHEREDQGEYQRENQGEDKKNIQKYPPPELPVVDPTTLFDGWHEVPEETHPGVAITGKMPRRSGSFLAALGAAYAEQDTDVTVSLNGQLIACYCTRRDERVVEEPTVSTSIGYGSTDGDEASSEDCGRGTTLLSVRPSSKISPVIQGCSTPQAETPCSFQQPCLDQPIPPKRSTRHRSWRRRSSKNCSTNPTNKNPQQMPQQNCSANLKTPQENCNQKNQQNNDKNTNPQNNITLNLTEINTVHANTVSPKNNITKNNITLKKTPPPMGKRGSPHISQNYSLQNPNNKVILSKETVTVSTPLGNLTTTTVRRGNFSHSAMVASAVEAFEAGGENALGNNRTEGKTRKTESIEETGNLEKTENIEKTENMEKTENIENIENNIENMNLGEKTEILESVHCALLPMMKMALPLIGRWETVLSRSTPLDPLFKAFGIPYYKRVVVDRLALHFSVSLKQDTQLLAEIHLPVNSRYMTWFLDGSESIDDDPDCGQWTGKAHIVDFQLNWYNDNQSFKALQHSRSHKSIGVVKETRTILPDSQFGRILYLNYTLSPKKIPEKLIVIERILKPINSK